MGGQCYKAGCWCGKSKNLYVMTTAEIITLIAAAEIPFFGFFGWMIRKLFTHDTALAILMNEVKPPHEKSLRTLVNEIRYRVDRG